MGSNSSNAQCISEVPSRSFQWRAFFENFILIINSYTGLVSFGRSHIKDTSPRKNNH